jgi:lipopolysaccharide export system permease protein
MAGMVAEATQHGLGPFQILAVMPLIIPSTLPYTLPATTLFATCVVYGRLAHDNEILAIKASGVNIMRVVWPGMLLGLAMTAVTWGLYYNVIPMTHHLMRTMFINDVEELLYGMLRRDGCIRHPKLNYEMYVKRVQGRKLLDAQFMRRDPKTLRYDVIARAREAELRVDMAHKLIHVHMHICHYSSGTGDIGYVHDKVWPVDLPPDLGVPQKQRGADMTWEELVETRADLAEAQERLDAEVALLEGKLWLSEAPDKVAEHVKNMRAVRQQKINDERQLEVEQHMRVALGIGCLCFVLVGCPVGIWFSKSDYLSAFITCFLPIVFLYYPVLLCGLNLAKAGKVPIAAAVWAADAAMAVIALGLFRRLVRN